jgi:lipopolysaccharide biosynthesis glycosyltransferase
MDVVYALDDRFAILTGISIESLLYNNKDSFDRITIHLLLISVSEENKAKISQIVSKYDDERDRITVRFYEHVDINKLDGLKTTKQWSVVTWMRLLLPDIFPALDKILYLDGDTVIDGSLKNLWETDVEEYSIAGVLDSTVYAIAERELYLDKLPKPYVNAGVLLINLRQWRKDCFTENAISYASERPSITFVDQDVINAIVTKKLILPARYNNYGAKLLRFLRVCKDSRKYIYKYYSRKELKWELRNTVIMHYGGSAYFNGNFVSYREAFRVFVKYKRMGPFNDAPDYFKGGLMTRLTGIVSAISPISLGQLYFMLKFRLKQ